MQSQRLNHFHVYSLLSQRLKHFRVCSAIDEICSAYAQHTLNDVFEMGKDFPLCPCGNCALSTRKNSLGVCSVCDEIVSSYAQCVIK
jgi:hypothetical protein